MSKIANNDYRSRLQALIAEALQVKLSEIPEELAFGDIPQWDSMGHMSIIMLLEERFSIEVDADVIESLTSISAMLSYLLQKEKQ